MTGPGQGDSVFDVDVEDTGDFNPTVAEAPDEKKARTPAQEEAVRKMQEGKRKALERRKAEKQGQRNTGDQRVHAAGSGHEATHDENTDTAFASDYHADLDNEVTEWIRPSDLEAPPARSGMVQRWIRIRLGTVRDTARLRKAMREGWRPVKASASIGHSLPIIQHDSLGEGDYIGAEDLILMEMPERVARQRERFYKRKQARQTGAVERQVKGVHSEDHIGFGNIRSQSRSRVKVSQGRARTVEAADDDF
jgi:hypothetical protein